MDLKIESKQNQDLKKDNARSRFTLQPGDLAILGECHLCKNNNVGAFGCKAFPYGIPDLILLGKLYHREFINGDNGIKFEPVDNA